MVPIQETYKQSKIKRRGECWNKGENGGYIGRNSAFCRKCDGGALGAAMCCGIIEIGAVDAFEFQSSTQGAMARAVEYISATLAPDPLCYLLLEQRRVHMAVRMNRFPK